jgi:tetratricopeptide (TPR) repeat protein
MAKKRMTRKELLKTPDEFMTFTGKVIRFAVQYKIQLVSVGVAIVFLIFFVIGFRYFSNRAESRANGLLQKNVALYETAMEEKNAYDAYLAVEGDFNRLIIKYRATASGKTARLVFANICYRAGIAERSMTLYRKALEDFKDYPLIRRLIIASLGYCSEAMKDYPAAAEYFNKIAESPGVFLKAEAMFQLGRIYETMGDAERSINAFKMILSDYPASMYVELAREKV